jgi:hypothetical protein
MTNGTDAPGGSTANSGDLLTLFGIVFETLRHEGNAIWERFNIIIGINLALFGAVGLVCFGQSRPVAWRGLGLGLSLAGLSIAVWSYYVLSRLWNRHAHWRARLVQIQEQFPDAWVRPLDQPGPGPQLTAPYIAIVIVGWLVLIGILLRCPALFDGVTSVRQ